MISLRASVSRSWVRLHLRYLMRNSNRHSLLSSKMICKRRWKEPSQCRASKITPVMMKSSTLSRRKTLMISWPKSWKRTVLRNFFRSLLQNPRNFLAQHGIRLSSRTIYNRCSLKQALYIRKRVWSRATFSWYSLWRTNPACTLWKLTRKNTNRTYWSPSSYLQQLKTRINLRFTAVRARNNTYSKSLTMMTHRCGSPKLTVWSMPILNDWLL